MLDLGHYASRLSKYYGDREAPALAILDALAREPEGLDIDELSSRLASERSILLPIVQDLRDDAYIVQRGHHLRFALDLVRRYWREDRML